MNHIDFENIVNMLFSEEYNEEFVKLGNKINSHILKCEECRRKYKSVKKVYDSIQKIKLENINLEKYLCSLYTSNLNIGIPIEHVIDEFVEKMTKYGKRILLNIVSFTEIRTSNFQSGFSFYHPSMSGIAKSVGNSTISDLNDVLIDDKLNRISISEDGCLSARFDKNTCDNGDCIFLISESEGEEPKVYVEQIKLCDDGFLRVVFDDIEPGEYHLVL